MATALESLVVSLALDSADLQNNLKSAQGSLDGFAKNAKAVGGVMSAAVTAPLVAIGLASVDMASDLSESMSKVDVVFGDSADEIVKWSETAGTSLGQSQQQALEAAGTFGNLFSAMGFTGDASQEMSVGIVELASDLASFNNIGTDEALEKLRAGLVGETEPLRALGVNLSAAAIEAQALKMGLAEVVVDEGKVTKAMIDAEQAAAKVAKATNEYGMESLEAREANNQYNETMNKLAEARRGEVQDLSAAAKAQASYALIMEQTKLAQGDFERTSDGLANTQRILQAELKNLSAELGQQLLPIALEVANGVKGLLGWFKELSPEVKHNIMVVAGIAAAVGPVIVVIGTLAGAISSIISVAGALSAALPLLGAALAVITAPIGLIVIAVAALAAAWATDFLGIKTKTEEFWTWISAETPRQLAELKSTWNTFTTWLTSDNETKLDTLQRGYDTIYSWLDTQTDGTLSTVEGYWDSYITSITTIAAGGIQIVSGDWEGGLDTIKTVTDTIWASIYGVFGTQIEAVKKVITDVDWLAVGSAIMQGIADGIDAGLELITNAAKNAAQSALDAAKNLLGISSPFKVAAKDIGMPLAQGIGVGIQRGLDDLVGRIDTGLSGMMGSLSAAEPTTAATGGNSITINIALNGSASYQDGRAVGAGVLDEIRSRGLS